MELPAGFAHHESLVSLELSGDSCQLCALIHASVERCRHRGGTLTGHFWLTKPGYSFRRYLSDVSSTGFMVFDGPTSEGLIHLIAALGICVNDGNHVQCDDDEGADL